MHARIGAARRRDANRTRRDPAQGLFERLLNRARVRLALPTVEGTTVVFDAERQPKADRNSLRSCEGTTLSQFRE
jgi:hypothetical protein